MHKKIMNHRVATWILMLATTLLVGCHSVRSPETPTGPHFRVLTYNVNWGVPAPDRGIEAILNSGADIVCLQETTPLWEQHLRTALSKHYPFMTFRQSEGRMGGGLGFLSKTQGSEVAYVPSETGWFDGWIMAFETSAGALQVLNVHLKPPVGESGSFNASGYLFTGNDRLKELQRYFSARREHVPILVAGDFNDTEDSAAVTWLKDKGMSSALSQFDHRTPTWQWHWGPINLRRRMDHILYPSELRCCSAEVIKAGYSDHFPVAATLERKPDSRSIY